MSAAERPRTSSSTASSMRTVSASPGNVPASTSARYCATAPRIVAWRSAYLRACFGVQSVQPSESLMTWIWPEHPAPAPIPIVGIRSRSVIAAASCSGTSSSTIENAPASWTASASARSCRAWSRFLPWTRTLPQRVDRLGRQPMWPMTGIPAFTSASIIRALRTPPSSLTAWTPASRMKRPAL